MPAPAASNSLRKNLKEYSIGFGCSKLSHHLTTSAAVRNLEAAYGQGITHFDVARFYGFGAAEGILGKFARGKRDKITITTKFGISPGNQLLSNLWVQNFFRQLYRMAGTGRKNIKKVAGKMAYGGDFSPQAAEASLATSLRELKTGYIDFLLLHEPFISDTQSGELIDWLEGLKSKGIIRKYGIGSFSQQIGNSIAELPSGYEILQTDSSFPFGSKLSLESLSGKSLFHFSPFRFLLPLRKLFRENTGIKKQASELLGFDAEEHLVRLCLMQHKWAEHPNTVLFASSSNENIRATLAEWEKIPADGQELREDFLKVRSLVGKRMEYCRVRF